MAIIRTLLTIAVLILSTLQAFASDLTIPQSTLYPYKSTIEIQDDFLTGINASGTVGELGWNLSGGTNTNQASEANRLGIFRKATSAVISTISVIALYGTSAGIDPALPTVMEWAVRLNTNDANTSVRVGSGNSAFANPPTHGIYLEKLDADTNWFCVTRAAGVQTRTDSTIAITTNFVTVRTTRNSSGVQFSIGGVNVCSVMTTNIPTTFVNPFVFIINSAAADKTIDLDYFQLAISGIVR